jgi:hypothetical protein
MQANSSPRSKGSVRRKSQGYPGGIVKAEGLGDGPSHGKIAIAKLL